VCEGVGELAAHLCKEIQGQQCYLVYPRWFDLELNFCFCLLYIYMLFQRFAPAAAVLSGTLYVTGGYDGNTYLQYDP